ncbi:LysR family transcriptional regulator [Nitrospirillum sp. BR 11163]|uniref:LysR family transcriptional regulator n=1 Tax=Nitrospirillum sp. BR 11163 TaxID=3104323 RepID=UPI002AFFF1A1|nr:LysR family transcriptional regulator [Nitrospirillum sp. BR 11163]MEA1673206.1 LysR family transcriptional regulator [Nitrospirillum sp. BR 11163]
MARVQMERSGEMEVFVRVVREGGFSAAARTLDLTPSAVSKLVARLEARLGARLLNRTTRALALTDEGRGYLQAAERALRALDDADQAVGSGTVRGRLVINASVPFGTHVLAPSLPAFLERHPDLTIDLSLTDDVVNLLARKADLAFRVGTLPDSALVARKLGQSRRVICAAPDYLARHGTPQAPADLARHNCLGFNFRRSRVGWPFREGGREVEMPVTGTLQVNNGETLRQMTLAGMGLARLSRWHVAEQIARGDLVPVLEAYNPGDLEMVNAVYVGGGLVPRRVRAFIDHMVAVMASSALFVEG